MLRNTSISFQLLTYGMLIGLSHAIIGRNVRNVGVSDYRYVLSLTKTVRINGFLQRLHFCTGSLISRRSVITAAHCLVNKTVTEIEILAGSNNLKYAHSYLPERWITYDEWMYGRRNHPSLSDIAIILHGAGVCDQDNHQIEILPIDPDNVPGNRARILTIAGWGRMETHRMPSSLRKGAARVISNEECSRRGTIVRGEPYSVAPNYFCSVAQPWILTSDGDGGAPVLNLQRKLVGINVGTIPLVNGRWRSEDRERLNTIQVNTHLRLRYYMNFTRSFML